MVIRRTVTDIMQTRKEKEDKLKKDKEELKKIFSSEANPDNLEKAKKIFKEYQQLCMDEDTYQQEYFNNFEIEIKLIAYKLSVNKKLKETDCEKAINYYNILFKSLYNDLNENDYLDNEEKEKCYLKNKKRVKDIIEICNYYCGILLENMKKEKTQENIDSLSQKMQEGIDIFQKYEQDLDNKHKQKLHLYIAEKNVLNGETEKALIEYDKAIDINPNDFETSNRKAIYFYKLEKYEEIENIYKPFLRIRSAENKLELYCRLSKTLVHLNKFDEAQKYIDKANELPNISDEKNNKILSCEALYYFKKEEYNKSSELYKKLQNEPYYKIRGVFN